MSDTPKIIHRKVSELRCHKHNRDVPRRLPGSEEWNELCDDVRERGIQEPLRIIGNDVVNGWTRHSIAKALQLETVPCIEVPALEVLATMREDFLRKHLNKGQRAFALYPLLQPIIDEIKERQVAALKNGNGRGTAEFFGGGPKSVDELCSRHKFSKDTYEMARDLHVIFSGDKNILRKRNLEGADWRALKEKFLPRILDMDDPISIGGALAGMGGKEATDGKERAVNAETQLELFTDGIGALTKVAKSWPKLKDDKKPEMIASFRKQVAAWSPDFCRDMAEVLKARMEDAA